MKPAPASMILSLISSGSPGTHVIWYTALPQTSGKIGA
jgi:hypothetical protein